MLAWRLLVQLVVNDVGGCVRRDLLSAEISRCCYLRVPPGAVRVTTMATPRCAPGRIAVLIVAVLEARLDPIGLISNKVLNVVVQVLVSSSAAVRTVTVLLVESLICAELGH